MKNQKSEVKSREAKLAVESKPLHQKSGSQSTSIPLLVSGPGTLSVLCN